MFVSGHNGQTVRIEVGESIDGQRVAVGIMRDRDEAQKRAGGEVGIAFCLDEVPLADDSPCLDVILTVRSIPSPAREP